MDHHQMSSKTEVAGLYAVLPIRDGNFARILNLLPGTKTSPLQAELSVVSLDSPPKYEAISYTWGASTKGCLITVNGGVRLQITDNLHQALYRLRRKDRARTLWADALCINQADVAERGHQVQLMGLIYSTATCVDIWLGEPGLVSPISLKMLGETWRIIDRAQTGEGWPSFAINPQAIEKAMQNSVPRWYDRGWVAQEYIMAKEVYFCYGSQRTSCHEISKNGWWYPKSHAKRDHLWKLTQRLKTYDIFSEKSGSSVEARGLFEAGVEAIADCDMTDPRDRVYSLLSFLNREEAGLLTPDYSLRPEQVFARATFASIKARGNFDMLRLVGLLGNRRTPDLPSWVVDFEDIGTTLGARSEYDDMYIGSPHPQHVAQDWISLDDTNRILRVKGHVGGTVAHMLPLSEKSFQIYFGTAHPYEDLGTEGKETPKLTSSLAETYRLFVLQAVRSATDRVESTAGINAGEMLRLWNQHSEVVVVDTLTPEDLILKKFIWDAIEAMNGAPVTTGGLSRYIFLASKEMGFRELGNKTPFETQPVYALREALIRWARCISNRSTEEYGGLDGTKPMENLKMFGKYAFAAAGGCSLFSTETGLIGLGPSSIAPGDKVIISDSPYTFLVLRPMKAQYIFRGLAIIHGLNTNPDPPDGRLDDLVSWAGITQEPETFEII